MAKARWVDVVLAVAVGACGHTAGEANAPSEVTPARITTVAFAPDSSKVDKVGAADGALLPDGTPDLAMRVQLEGPVTALFVVATDKFGRPMGKFQADTLVGGQAMPRELAGAHDGKETSGLGVFEGNQLLNSPDGSLSWIGGGPHTITLYVNGTPSGAPDLRVYALGADKLLAVSSVVRR